MSGRVPWWHRVLALVVLAGLVRAAGLPQGLFFIACFGAGFLYVRWRASRARRGDSGGWPPPRPKPIDVQAVPSRSEAGLLLVTVLGFSLVAASYAINLIYKIVGGLVHGPGDYAADWTLWPFALGAVTAPFTFLAYAILVSRRAGDQRPQVEQFVSRAVIREAIAQFSAHPAPRTTADRTTASNTRTNSMRKGYAWRAAVGIVLAPIIGMLMAVATQSVWGLLVPAVLGAAWFLLWEWRTRPVVDPQG